MPAPTELVQAPQSFGHVTQSSFMPHVPSPHAAPEDVEAPVEAGDPLEPVVVAPGPEALPPAPLAPPAPPAPLELDALPAAQPKNDPPTTALNASASIFACIRIRPSVPERVCALCSPCQGARRAPRITA